MKFSAHATVEGAPRFDVRANAEPIRFDCGARGSVHARVGPVRARVREIPITLAVPFLGGVQRIGAVGPFDVRLEPIDVGIESLELRCEGVLGPEGLTVGLEGGMGCKLEVDAHGRLPGGLTKLGFELAGNGDPQEEQ